MYLMDFDFEFINCCCKSCRYQDDCDYFNENIAPVSELVEVHLNSNADKITDSFVRDLNKALDNFTCQDYDSSFED
jgi:hypothetical protein